jgi:hypothetical protein
MHTLINNNNYDTFHICCPRIDYWNKDINILQQHPKINNTHIYIDCNPIYNVLDIDVEYKCIPNLRIPYDSLEINSIVYYKLIGLNNNVRMNYFNYHRNYEKEKEMKEIILKKFNIKSNEKYNIINTIGSEKNIDVKKLDKYIRNSYVNIDINYLVDFPGWLFLLIEDAEEIHLIEGFNTNFIYHSQFKDILHIKHKKVFFHIWARMRKWSEYNLDWSWKMMDYPKLQNWEFIYNE